MPASKYIHTSFIGGQIGRYMHGRVDLKRYNTGASLIRNYIVCPQGGVVRRPGTVYAGLTKAQPELPSITTAYIKAIPFVFSTTQAYVMEFGPLYARFFTEHGRLESVDTYDGDGATKIFAYTATNSGPTPVYPALWTWAKERDEGFRVFVGEPPLFTMTIQTHQVAYYKGNGTTTSFTTLDNEPAPIIYVDNVLQVIVTDYTMSGDIVTFVSAPVDGAEIAIMTADSTYYVDNWGNINGGNINFLASPGIGVGNIIITVQVEVSHPFTPVADDTQEVNYTQDADVMFLVHRDVTPHRLERVSEFGWQIVPIDFDPPPTFEKDTDLNTTLTPDAVTGDDVDFVTGDPVWLAADAGRQIYSSGSRAVIDSVFSATIAKVNILVDFPSTDTIPAGEWVLQGSPVVGLKANKGSPVNAQAILETEGTIDAFRNEDVGKYIHIFGGVMLITGILSPARAEGIILTEFTDWTDDLTYTPLWTLEVKSWSFLNGFPGTVSLFEGRLWYAGSKEQPKTIWGSATNIYNNFATGTLADAAVEFTLAGNQHNRIHWLVGHRKLMIGTSHEEYLASGTGTNAPITPTNINITSESNFGSHFTKPVRIGSTILFVSRSRNKLIEFIYDLDFDSFVSNDLTIGCDEILAKSGGAIEMAHQQDPWGVIWVSTGGNATAGGQLVGLTYNRREDVVAWHEHAVGSCGHWQSLCSIPNPGYSWASIYGPREGEGDEKGQDEIWVVSDILGTIRLRAMLYMSRQVTTDFTRLRFLISDFPASGQVTGFNHLNGLEAAILGSTDNFHWFHYDNQTVGNGTISIDRTIEKEDWIGLKVGIMHSAYLVTIPPEIPSMGTIQGRQKRWNELYVKLAETQGLKINGTDYPERTPYSETTGGAGDIQMMGKDRLNELQRKKTFGWVIYGTWNDFAPNLWFFPRDVKVYDLGYDRYGRVVIEDSTPFPSAILAVYGQLNVGNI